MAGPSQLGSLVIVFDADFVGIALLPPERHTVLIVDSNTVAPRLIPFELFESIARWNLQIVELSSHVESFQCPLRRAPDIARNFAARPGVSLTKQVNGGFVGEGLDHALCLLGDTRAEMLRPSDTTSRCPYKGFANYYSMVVNGKTYDDIVWSYRAATFASQPISGMVSFYNEKVDAILTDGKELPKPKSRNR